jgi:hypothetical protein
MTLKEKFIKTYRKVFSVENLAEECIKITDDYAIGFAKWMYDYKGDINKVEELLEIYKKEKGL